MPCTESSFSGPDPDEEGFADDITMRRGPAWVLVSVPEIYADGNLSVKVECGPVVGMDELRAILAKTLEAL